jgi:5-methylcytosine-specific restriction endonuclease McrA
MKKPRSLKSQLLSSIGKVWMYWPDRLAVKRRCKNPKRTGWFFCEQCKTDIQKVEVDHIVPVVLPEEGFKGWDVYLERKFVGEENLMGLCHECHLIKSKKEGLERKKHRAANKIK